MPVYKDKAIELAKLPRDKYMEEYRKRGKKIWDKASIPTVSDIAKAVVNDEITDDMQYMFDFFDNEEKFMNQAHRVNNHYREDESADYIQSVVSANVSDIADAGYFYKQLIASGDAMRIVSKDCGSKGEYIPVPDNETSYIYLVKGSWVQEYGDYMLMDFKEFSNWTKKNKLKEIHVRTPATCKHAPNRNFCEKCCGHLPEGTKNIGAFTTLCITEFATQNALSSMNNGVNENINFILTRKYEPRTGLWSDIIKWIDEVTEKLEDNLVARRFYQIALISRVHREENEDDVFKVVSLKTSIGYTSNKLGAYLFAHNITNFRKMVQAGRFEDNSMKVQIALNQYNRR